MSNRLQRFLLFLFYLTPSLPCYAGVVFQNFEPDNGLEVKTWPVGNAAVSTVGPSDAVHSGKQAVRVYSASDYWTGVGIQARARGDLDIKQTNNDRLSFWIYARPVRLCYIYGCSNGTSNTVGVRFYDNNKYTSGFEVWTTQTAAYSQWTKLKVLFSQLPPDLDLRHITKIEFKNYYPGNYYFDDIQAAREDRNYQNFEAQERAGSTAAEYGWKWNDADAVGFSGANEPAQGAHSWKLTAAGRWSGTGIQSGEKKYVINASGNSDQDFWHVDLAPEINDRITYWVYAQPLNGMDNNVSIQVYDNGAHRSDVTKVSYWPKTPVVAGKWTRVTVPFSELLKIAPDLNLKDINKIQFQHYWPGTYYLDNIRAAGPVPVLRQVSNAAVQWTTQAGNVLYRLQVSATGQDGSWKDVYAGARASFTLPYISKNYLRVRWEETAADKISVPYVSDWSDVLEFLPPAVYINYSLLRSGLLLWSTLPQKDLVYELQSSPEMTGPWTTGYKGPALTTVTLNNGASFTIPKIIPAVLNRYYRVRAVQQAGGVVNGLTPWSNPQAYMPGRNFVKQAGTLLRAADGRGSVLTLNGVNLGSLFVIEPWMSGLGQGSAPALADDWSIRNVLTTRFGKTTAAALMASFQEAYMNDNDFDDLSRHGVSVVRLPFYYRNLQDDNGGWVRDALGRIDFGALDRIVNGLANRGIYVVLDLHGAPGLQSADANTGRQGVNKLFAADGEVYRQRTVDLWKQVAAHYRANAWVLGYDLLNEPVGAAPDFIKLADMYDRIYKGIRSVDPNHLIIMEGIWYTDPSTNQETVDWGTLPYPSVRGWSNIMYQFHFYHWDFVDANGQKQKADEDYPSHKAFIDQKLAAAAAAQPAYNVPLMIGEFYGFGLKDTWDYYIKNFNAKQWSWTSWSYKYHDSPSNWGIFNHTGYGVSLPDFAHDSLRSLASKISKYTTVNYHTRNATLLSMIEASGRSTKPYPPTSPFITGLSALYLEAGQDMYITGHNFGTTQGSSVVLYNGDVMPVISWSDTSLRVYVKSGTLPSSAPVTVRTSAGTSNGEDIIVVAHDPAMDPPPDTSTPSSQPEIFLDTFERCNGRPLGTHGCV